MIRPRLKRVEIDSIKLESTKKAEVSSEPCQTSKTERFAKTANNWKPLTIFAKCSILDVWQGSEYGYESITQYLVI